MTAWVFIVAFSEKKNFHLVFVCIDILLGTPFYKVEISARQAKATKKTLLNASRKQKKKQKFGIK